MANPLQSVPELDHQLDINIFLPCCEVQESDVSGADEDSAYWSDDGSISTAEYFARMEQTNASNFVFKVTQLLLKAIRHTEPGQAKDDAREIMMKLLSMLGDLRP